MRTNITDGADLPRELGEVINYAIVAYRKKVAVEKIFVLNPTDASGYTAAYVERALAHHLSRPGPSSELPPARVRVLAHALCAYKELLPPDELFTVIPTPGAEALAVFIDQAIELHHKVPDPVFSGLRLVQKS